MYAGMCRGVCVCVCICSEMCMCVGMCICPCMWRPEVNLRSFPLWLSFIFEDRVSHPEFEYYLCYIVKADIQSHLYLDYLLFSFCYHFQIDLWCFKLILHYFCYICMTVLQAPMDVSIPVLCRAHGGQERVSGPLLVFLVLHMLSLTKT